MSDCIFCKIISGEAPSYKIYEDDKVVVFLNIFPVSKGATLIVPKNHNSFMADGPEEDALAMMKALYKIAPLMMEGLGATGYNLGMNHGESAGPEILHTHIHVMPRYDGEKRSFERYEASKEELEDAFRRMKSKM